MKPPRTISRSVMIGLRFIGCWPDCPFTIYTRVFWVTTMLIIQTFQYWYFALHFNGDDLTVLMDNLSVTIAYTLTMIKLISLWLNRRIFYDMLTEMARDWKECSNDLNMRTMTNKASLSLRFSNSIIAVYGIASLLYGSGSIASQGKLPNDRDDLEDGTTERDLLFKMQLPFESNQSPVYELIVVSQCIHQLLTSVVAGMLNGLILTLILHLGGQIEIMCDALIEISTDDSLEGSTVSMMKSLVGRHQRIIAFSDNIEHTFSYITLSQFLSNTLIMCALGYQIVVSLGTDDWIATVIRALWFYAVMSLEAFIICFSGEYIGVKSKAIGDAAYNSLWYDMRPTQARVLLLMIIRAQKKLVLTTGKFMDLSLERFTTIMKASASYISVLHAMS